MRVSIGSEDGTRVSIGSLRMGGEFLLVLRI